MTTLSLQFTKDTDGKTYLENQFASYPFHICRSQYFDNDPPGMANVYIQSASGGIYDNENLTTTVRAGAQSFSHITTQASTIVHGMSNGGALQTINIHATDSAYTEYISDPLILFPESKLRSDINVYVDHTSTAVIADAFLLHFLRGDDHLFDQLNTYLRILTDDERLLAKDVYRVCPGNFYNGRRNFISMGTLTIANRSNACDILLEPLQHKIIANKSIYGGATLLPNNCGIIAKFLAPDGDSLKKAILEYWCFIRESLVGIKPKFRKK